MCFHMFIIGLMVFATYFQGGAQDAPQLMMPAPAPTDQSQQPMTPPPVDQSQQPVIGAPMPDMSAQQPPVPVPDATVQPQPMQAPVPAPAVGGEVKSEQLGWPDTIEVSEVPQGIAQGGAPGIGQAFKDAEKSIQTASLLVQDLTKKREALHTQFFELDARLDEFFQNTTFTLGKVQETGGAGEGGVQMNQANELVRDIGVGKDALKNFLTSINNAIQEVKSLVLQARQKSLEILKQGSEDGAKALKQAVDGLAVQITQRGQEIETSIIAAFGAQLAQINDQIAKVQPILGALQAREFVAKAKEEQMAVTQQIKETVEPAKHTFQSWFIPEEETVAKKAKKPGEEKTFIHYLFARLADLITEILRILYDFFQSIKNWFFPPQQTLGIVDDKKKMVQTSGKNAPVSPTNAPAPAPVMPAASVSTMPSPQAPTDQSASGQMAAPANG